MTQHITLGGLPLVNLKRKPFRTAALTIVVAMLTVAFYGGSLLSMNLEAGLNSMQERMGADLMVTPQNTKNEAEALLTNGSASTFYFTNEITDEVAKADGIDEITEQTYISSLAAACCDEKVQIIGFNPDTDFVITPWIASQFDGTLQRGQIVAGASISVSGNNTVKLYGHEFPVAAQLANTGTSLDNSVFVNMQTFPTWSDIPPRWGMPPFRKNMPTKPFPPCSSRSRTVTPPSRSLRTSPKQQESKASDTCIRGASQPQRNPI